MRYIALNPWTDDARGARSNESAAARAEVELGQPHSIAVVVDAEVTPLAHEEWLLGIADDMKLFIDLGTLGEDVAL